MTGETAYFIRLSVQVTNPFTPPAPNHLPFRLEQHVGLINVHRVGGVRQVGCSQGTRQEENQKHTSVRDVIVGVASQCWWRALNDFLSNVELVAGVPSVRQDCIGEGSRYLRLETETGCILNLLDRVAQKNIFSNVTSFIM